MSSRFGSADQMSTNRPRGLQSAQAVLLSARRPRNPIGWLLLVLMLLAANPASYYAILDYRLHHGTLPLGWAAVLFLASSPAVPVLLAILLWV